ncbi:hypothetical protein IWZ01DRAFT_574834 [Phyllosticta capitalensis]
MEHLDRPANGFDIREEHPEGSAQYGFQDFLRILDDQEVRRLIRQKNYEQAVRFTSVCLRDRTLPLHYRWAYEIYLCIIAAYLPGCRSLSEYHGERAIEVEQVIKRKADLLEDQVGRFDVYFRMNEMRDDFRQLRDELRENDSIREMLGVSLETYRAMKPQVADLPSLVQKLRFHWPDTGGEQEQQTQLTSKGDAAEGASGAAEEEAGSNEQ